MGVASGRAMRTPPPRGGQRGPLTWTAPHGPHPQCVGLGGWQREKEVRLLEPPQGPEDPLCLEGGGPGGRPRKAPSTGGSWEPPILWVPQGAQLRDRQAHPQGLSAWPMAPPAGSCPAVPGDSRSLQAPGCTPEPPPGQRWAWGAWHRGGSGETRGGPLGAGGRDGCRLSPQQGAGWGPAGGWGQQGVRRGGLAVLSPRGPSSPESCSAAAALEGGAEAVDRDGGFRPLLLPVSTRLYPLCRASCCPRARWGAVGAGLAPPQPGGPSLALPLPSRRELPLLPTGSIW